MIVVANIKIKKHYHKIKSAVLISFFIAIIMGCIFITAAPKLDLSFNVPSWSDLFSKAGLRNNTEANKQPLSVHFIDVGQGDCILIVTAEGNMLIDAGEPGESETVIRYLRNLNVSKLDYIIVTHPDSDHIGGMADVIETFEVANIIMPNIENQNYPTTTVFEKLLISINNKSGLVVLPATAGEIFNLSDATVTILGPVNPSQEMNNMSTVIRVELGSTSFLFAGDAEIDEENDILNNFSGIKSDVLKAGHHGSRNSSGDDFLNAVLPEKVIISCGRDNSFNHPNTEALDRFNNINAEVIRTDQYGTIVIGSDGENLTVYCEKNSGKYKTTNDS